MSVARFFIPDAFGAADALVTLPADEAHHLRHVLRLAPGATVRVFDGRGHEWAAVVESAAGRSTTVRLGAPVDATPEPPVTVTVAAGLVKLTGDRMDVLVRDAVMLGASAIAPFISAHVTVPKAAWRGGGPVVRWQRVAVASAKQCGRAVVPTVAPVAPLADLLAAANADRVLIAVEPSADLERAPDDPVGGPPPASVLLLLGPEGGWTPEEVALAAAHGAHTLRLGPRTLRAETAPVVALTTLWARWGWQ